MKYKKCAVTSLVAVVCVCGISLGWFFISQNSEAHKFSSVYETDSNASQFENEMPDTVSIANIEVTPVLYSPHTLSPTTTMSTLFQLLATQEYEKAAQYIMLSDEDNTMLMNWNEDVFAPTIPLLLSRYCEQNGGVCLSVHIVSSTVTTSTAEVVVQFIQKDGTVFVFEPCCGADEKDILPIDTFTYQLQYIQDGWRVTTLPPYRS